ncbi:MAG TPA: hypothetical protein VGH28_28670 [Polyangiaceae bacterium]
MTCNLCDASPAIALGASDDSPPNALVVSIPPLPAYPGNASAEGWIATGLGASKVSLAFDFKVDQASGALLSLFTVAGFYVRLDIAASSITITEQDLNDGGGSYGHMADAGVVDLTKWHRFSMTYDLDTRAARVTLDGITILSETFDYTGFGSILYQLGVEYVQGPSSAQGYHYDNVVLATTP